MADINYPAEYDTRSESQRADALPPTFGHDDPEVIRLVRIRDEVQEQSKGITTRFQQFDEWRCGFYANLEKISCEIVEIDRRRPQLLADLFIAGEGFERDDEQQQRRADLQKEVERHKLAGPLLSNSRQSLEQQSQEGHRKYSKACQDVDAKLAEIRMAHIVSQRR